MIHIRKSTHAHPTSLLCFMKVLLAVGVLAGTVGCDSMEGDDNDVPAITSAGGAEFVVEHLAEWILYDKVIRPLAPDDHSQTVVSGSSGRATVAGHKTYSSGLSCGSDCVGSEADVHLTIVLDNFEITSPGDIETYVHGTITYRDNTWSRQSGLSYSSGGSITVEGAGVRFKIVGQDAAGQWGYQDTITFHASGRSATANLSGSCQTSSGTTYQF